MSLLTIIMASNLWECIWSWAQIQGDYNDANLARLQTHIDGFSEKSGPWKMTSSYA
jgi:hypothetical protein